MTTKAISIPVTPGAVGAAIDASQLGNKKTFVIADLDGTINIEAGINGVFWPIGSFSDPRTDEIFKVICDELRVDATNASAATVTVAAEETVSRFVTLPASGAPVDAVALGDLSTAIAQAPGHVEASQDGVEWSQVFRTFTGPDCDQECFSAAYLRAVGNSDIQIGSQQSNGTAGGFLTRIVYRPDATGEDAPGGNVYTDWQSAYDAARAATSFGLVALEFDASSSNHLNGYGRQACPIPAGTWDFSDIFWFSLPQKNTSYSRQTDSRVDILEGANIFELWRIDGPGTMVVTYDGSISGPIRVANYLEVACTCGFSNTDPAAAPMFRVDDSGGSTSAFVAFAADAQYGGIGGDITGDPDAVAPLIDTTGGTFTILQQGSVTVKEDMARGTGTFRLFKGPLADGVSKSDAGTYQVPTLIADGGSAQVRMRYEGGLRLEAQLTTVTSGDSPYDLPDYRDVLYVDSSGGPITINLPQTQSPLDVQDEAIVVHDVSGDAGTNNITVVPFGAETIAGAASIVVAKDYGSVCLIARSGDWAAIFRDIA